MRNLVRSIFITCVVLSATFVLHPTVAHATRVTLIRVTSLDMRDEVLAFELTNQLHASASLVAGWGVSIASTTLPQILLSNNCEGVVPDTACLVHLTNTPGSGAYGPIIIYGTLQRRGEGDAMRLELDLVLFDTVSGAEPRHVVANLTLEELNDADVREHLIQGWLIQLMTGVAPDVAVSVEDPAPPPPPGRPSDPREAFEIAGWSLVGVAGAALVGALVSGGLMLGLTNDADYQAYRSSWDATRVSDVCASAASDMSDDGRHALSVCNDAALHEILVPLFWTVAGIAGAAGVILAWHPWTASGSEARPTARLVPSLSPTRAGLGFALEF